MLLLFIVKLQVNLAPAKRLLHRGQIRAQTYDEAIQRQIPHWLH